MVYKSPAGREFDAMIEREQREAEQGIYEETLAVGMFKRGELTYQQLLDGYRNKTIRPRPRRFPIDTMDPEEVLSNSRPDQISLLKMGGHITPEQATELRLARSGYVGDGDPRNTPRLVPLDMSEMPPRDPNAEKLDPGFDYYLLSRTPGWKDYRALIRVENGLTFAWNPKTREWIDAPWEMDAIYGDEKATANPVTADMAQIELNNPEIKGWSVEEIQDLRDGVVEDIEMSKLERSRFMPSDRYK